MNDSWLIRWDVRGEARPVLWIPETGAEKAVAFFGPDDASGAGGFAVCSGYLFEKTSLGTDAHASEAGCVASAYRQYGEGVFDRLRGGWAAAVWDAEREQLLAGRDAMAFRPLYYAWDERLFLLSPDLDLLLAQPEVPVRVNRQMLAEYLQFIWLAHQRFETFYDGVGRVPAAHRLCLSGGRLQFQRYWDPLPLGFPWASEEELATLIPVLERSVGRCLEAGADCLALSGGFDSVSIAVLAAEQLQGKRPLHAISLHNTLREIDESATQRAVAAALGMPQILRTSEECMAGRSFVEASLALSRTSPLPVLSVWQAIYTGLFESATGLGLSKLILGTGGDEMLTVDLAFGADQLASLDLAGLWRFYRAMVRTSPFSPLRITRVVLWEGAAVPLAIRGVRKTLEWFSPGTVKRLRRDHLAPRPWIGTNDPDLRQALEERRVNSPEEPLARGEGQYVKRMRGLVQSPLLMAEMEQGGSWARVNGFSQYFPFLDRDVVDLSLRIHPDHLLASGLAKTPLRQLVAERLPQVEMPTKKVDFTSQVNYVLREQGQAAWRSLGGPQRLSEIGVVGTDLVKPWIEDYFNGRNDRGWLRTWMMLSAESWLRARFT